MWTILLNIFSYIRESYGTLASGNNYNSHKTFFFELKNILIAVIVPAKQLLRLPTVQNAFAPIAIGLKANVFDYNYSESKC
jgi:hypothetical protein